jgi:hypothetical protein
MNKYKDSLYIDGDMKRINLIILRIATGIAAVGLFVVVCKVLKVL